MRLIDADALIEKMEDVDSWLLYDDWGNQTVTKDLIDNAPTIDTVQIIRRKERVMKEFEDRKEFEKIFETVRKNIKEQITTKGVFMKGSAKGAALSEIIAVFDEELEFGIAEELRKGRGLIRAYYRKYNEVESLERKLRENEQKIEAQQKLSNTISLLSDDTLKNAIVAYEALSDRRGRSDAKEIVIAYIKSKGREDLMDVVEQTERREE